MLSRLIRNCSQLSVLLVLATLLVTNAACTPPTATIGIDAKTIDVITKAINELGAQPGAWNDTMVNTIDELGRIGTQTAKDVLAEVQSAYSSALGNTEAAAFCGADFIGHRLKENLQAILHELKKSEPNPVIVPVVCTTNPSDHIEPWKTVQVTYYGYDFTEFSKSGTFDADLQYAATGQVVRQGFGFVAQISNYELTVDLQAVDYTNVDKSQGPQLVLKWGGQNVGVEGAQSEMPIIFPTPTPTPTLTPTPIPPSDKFKIDVTTGDVQNAGTDANVYIILYGNLANSDETQLDTPGYDDFERNTNDTFTIVTSQNLGNITQIRIRHDNSGNKAGWFLDKIVITNLDTGQQWTFNAHRWLAKDEGDGAIDILLQPS